MPETHCPECHECDQKFRDYEALDNLLGDETPVLSGIEPGHLDSNLPHAGDLLKKYRRFSGVVNNVFEARMSLRMARKWLELQSACASVVEEAQTEHKLCEEHDAS